MKGTLLILLSLLYLFTSCSLNEDLKDTSYTTMAISFDPQQLAGDYKIIINGNTENAVSTSKPAKVDIYRKTDNRLVFSGMYLPTDSLKLIHPIGTDSLVLFSNEKYMGFSPQISYSDDPELYDVYLGKEKIKVSTVDVSYVSISSLPVNLRIVEKATSTTVYTQELNSESPTTFTLLQLSSNEFLNVPMENEPLPSDKSFKVRFFCTSKILKEPVKLILYIVDGYGQNMKFFTTLDLSPDKLSKYIEVPYDYYKDGKKQVNFYYDIENDRGEKLVDHTTNKKALIMIRNDGVNYSFMTFQLEELGSPWLRVNSLWIER